MRGGPATLVVADRGASAEAPEHTIAAYELALGQGADALVLDLHAARDEEPVVIHDFTLERTTDGAGPVVDRTVRDLKRLDAGGWWDARFAGQRVQALHEVLERFRQRAGFVLVLRGGRACYPTLAERVVALAEIYEVVHRVLVVSLDRDALGEVRALNDAVAVGVLVPPGAPLPAGPPGSAVCVEGRALSAGAVAGLRGVACYAWAVREPAEAERLAGWGVRGVVTDRPGPIATRLGR